MSFDWTRNHDLPVSDYCQNFRQYDWRHTSLGPMEGWPTLLRQRCCEIMLNPAPRMVCWGKDLALIYNEAALPMVSVLGKHPEQLGQPVWSFWAELLEQGFQTMFDQVIIHGRSATVENQYFELRRPPSSRASPNSRSQRPHESNDLSTKEAYYNFSLLPILDASGAVAGVNYEGAETTAHVVVERRITTLLDIENRIHETMVLQDVWKNVLDGLGKNVQDVPFAFLYSGTGDSGSMTERLLLEGSIGLPKDHPVANLHSANTTLTPLIAKTWESGKAMMVNCADLKWQSELASARHADDSASEHQPFIIPGRGFETEVTSALILPIPRLAGSEPIGILILGMNPQQAYDEPYQKWIRQLTESLVRVVASVSIPDELRRQQRAIREMAAEHARIASVLIGKKREEELAATTLKRIADMAPVGMAMFAPDGRQIWVNQGYAKHLRLSRDEVDLDTVKTNIHPDDRVVVDEAKKGTALPLNEMRILRGEPDPDFEPLPGDDGYDWIMAAPQVLYDEFGNVESIFGWTMEITHKKRAERLQAQRLEEQAHRIQDILEAKRQSENFIDMTSHEMRNPLSSIILSAEFIISVVGSSDRIKDDDDYKAILESAEVINLCAQHQKRIVDDLLTISKLDAKLLLISREKVDPRNILQNMVQMYDGELKTAGIETELVVDQSLHEMAVDRVTVDPSRLLQVLINIFTNAIKFTRRSPRRKITLTLSSLYARPAYGPRGGSYVPIRPQSEKLQTREQKEQLDTSSRDTIFLQFAIEDTGRGLSPDEVGALFRRFSQASPKTYGKYGGSGLGLFISRELIELQGGQIGVHSVLGEGTTFFCYVECKRHRPDPERSNEQRRRSSAFDIAQEVKRHKSDALLIGCDTPPASPDPPASPSDSPSTQLYSNLDLSSLSPASPLDEFVPVKQLGVIHVLIVEDNKINQKVLSQQLKREGCIIHTADHGGQALDFLLQSTFAIPQDSSVNVQKYTACSVVLMDVEMPVMNGLTAARCIRKLEREGKLRRHIPIIAITANARAEQRDEALEAGMNSVITKPFRVPDVVEKMKYWILETDARRVDEWKNPAGR